MLSLQEQLAAVEETNKALAGEADTLRQAQSSSELDGAALAEER